MVGGIKCSAVMYAYQGVGVTDCQKMTGPWDQYYMSHRTKKATVCDKPLTTEWLRMQDFFPEVDVVGSTLEFSENLYDDGLDTLTPTAYEANTLNQTGEKGKPSQPSSSSSGSKCPPGQTKDELSGKCKKGH
ncbi:uncharacterized protein LOC118437647 [Folsomia candida]|nr:uncharacterized protein LOC118437647 [Folsomia candida]